MSAPVAPSRFANGASVLVAALSSAFGVVLLQVTGALSAVIAADDLGSVGSVKLALTIVAFLFITIAVYVGSIVTVNTVATIIAGRTRTIALLRLLGASARTLRRQVATEGLVIGMVGALLGAVVGILLSAGVVSAAQAFDVIPDIRYELVDPLILLPVIVVALSTWLASWVGSRRVLAVSPMQAVGAAEERSGAEAKLRKVRNVVALGIGILGVLLLVGGIAFGLISIFGVLIALVGGILSFTGIVLGAPVLIPTFLRLAGRALGTGPAAKLASANALRYPERSARATIGLVIGVTLITMFAVAAQSYQDMMTRSVQSNPDALDGADDIVTMTVMVFSVLIGFSALIAAVGMVNNLAMSVLQRQRELGLLRALGFTAAQTKRMILAESTQMSIAAVGLGLLLGIIYGWAGAQSLLGSLPGVGLLPPAVPWQLVVGCAIGATVLSLAASVLPARRATTLSPMVALAAD